MEQNNLTFDQALSENFWLRARVEELENILENKPHVRIERKLNDPRSYIRVAHRNIVLIEGYVNPLEELTDVKVVRQDVQPIIPAIGQEE